MQVNLEEYKKIDTGDAMIDSYYYLDDFQKEELLRKIKISKEIQSFEFHSDFLLENGWVATIIGEVNSKEGFGLYLFTDFQDYQKVREIETQVDESDTLSQENVTGVLNQENNILINKKEVRYKGMIYYADSEFVYFDNYNALVKINKSKFKKYREEITENILWLGIDSVDKDFFDKIDSCDDDIVRLLSMDKKLLDYTLNSISILDATIRKMFSSEKNLAIIPKIFSPIYLYIVKCILDSYGKENFRLEVQCLIDETIVIPKIYFRGKLVKLEDSILLFLSDEISYGESEPLRFSIEKYFSAN